MKLTEIEKIILENTDKEYKYIARDEDGNLFLYTQEPFKNFLDNWRTNSYYNAFDIYNHLFKDIKWEDKKPYKFR